MNVKLTSTLCCKTQGYGMLKADGGSYLSINILVGGQDATLLPEKVLLNSTECRLYNIWT